MEIDAINAAAKLNIPSQPPADATAHRQVCSVNAAG
ncbi:putative type III secretion apparatus [Yersinia enterocolitica]|uniref:Type III secretion apparatus n=1 Tax=Yersinia enterocolitica TaxID=630 RepID=A0ABP1Y3E2_YEREN|nr:putative type III secretion apparatus [Yersinia enterocolitica]CND26023.1 putative type III secretion apparatus [Yersinia enterocolitica]CNE21064.1 putative type III secretion apparatus [Yersinia enterocolitica]CNE81349.1 putative type III secretion apparatus [Yersinia enterocolitica]CQD64025.1 putative type III secretion apparatus [Yersinia enterocolitica]